MGQYSSFFFPQKKRKLEWWHHLHSFWLLRSSRNPAATLLGFPHHLHSHCVGEPGHKPDYQAPSQTPHPMYFFLSYLSFVDFCYSTVVTPKLLEKSFVQERTFPSLDASCSSSSLAYLWWQKLSCGQLWPMTYLWQFLAIFSTHLSCPRSFVPCSWVPHTLGV